MTELARAAARMESIGRNCEFGLVQQQLGVEQISLLRYSATPAESLVDGLSHGFEGLAETMTGRGDPPGAPPERQEWWLTCSRYGILFHSGQNAGATTVEQATNNIRARLRWLAVKLLDDIRDGEKLFVFSDATMRSPLDALPILAAMRRIGRAQLLVVLPGSSEAAWTYRVNDGLIAGFTPRLTEVGDAIGYHKPSWEAIIPQAVDEWSRTNERLPAHAP